MRTLVVVFVAVVLVGAVVLLRLSAPAGGVQVQPAASADPLQMAQALADSKGCRACHSLDGSAGIGPSWLHSYGAVRTFADGSTAVVDEDYLRQSMQQPAVRVVAGFQNVMVAAELSDEEMSMLIALIRSLAADASR